jgi:hypothetical protein
VQYQTWRNLWLLFGFRFKQALATDMAAHTNQNDQRVAAFLHEAKSMQMRRYVNNLPGMEVEFDLPDDMMVLLRQLEDVSTWPK